MRPQRRARGPSAPADCPGWNGSPLFRKIAAVAGSFLKSAVAVAKQVDVALVEHEAVLRKADRRREQRRARHRAVLARARTPCRATLPGTPTARWPLVLGALDDVAVLVEVHVGRGGERRFLAEVEEGLAAVGELDAS